MAPRLLTVSPPADSPLVFALSQSRPTVTTTEAYRPAAVEGLSVAITPVGLAPGGRAEPTAGGADSSLSNQETNMRRTPSFTPRLEGLGDRTVPAVVSAFNASTGVLSITDNGADAEADSTVSVSAVGRDLVVTSTVDGETTTRTFRNRADDLTRINADLGEGDDTFTADLGGIAKGDRVVVRVDGGQGNDTITVNAGKVQQDATLRLNLIGGEGDDEISVNADGVDKGGTLRVNVDGDVLDADTDAGVDTVSIDLGAVDRGSLAVLDVDLGAGDDVVSLTGDGADRGSIIRLNLDAGTGADEVSVDVGSIDRAARFRANVDVGDDLDIDDLSFASLDVRRGASLGVNLTEVVETGDDIDPLTVDLINVDDLSADATVRVNGEVLGLN